MGHRETWVRVEQEQSATGHELCDPSSGQGRPGEAQGSKVVLEGRRGQRSCRRGAGVKGRAGGAQGSKVVSEIATDLAGHPEGLCTD